MRAAGGAARQKPQPGGVRFDVNTADVPPLASRSGGGGSSNSIGSVAEEADDNQVAMEEDLSMYPTNPVLLSLQLACCPSA